MKVAFDHQVFSDQPYGGISRYIIEVARHLNEISPDVQGRIFAGLHYNRYLVDENLGFAQGMYFEPRRFTGRIRHVINGVYANLVLRQWQPDVIHESYYHPTGWGPRSAKRVVTVHDMIHELYPELFPADGPVTGWKRAALARADAIVCVSETTKADLQRLMPEYRQPTFVIPHGHGYKPASEQARQTINRMTTGWPYILFVGKRGLYKNFDILLQAYANSPELKNSHRLVAFGGGPWGYDEVSRINELGLEAGQIIQIGGSDDLLHAAYELASTFVYPSLYEGFGIPIIEAFAAGCPAVCSDIPVFREVAGRSGTFFKPEDYTSLRIEIENIIDTRKRIRPESSIKKIYSWQASSEKHHRVYKELASSKKVRGAK